MRFPVLSLQVTCRQQKIGQTGYFRWSRNITLGGVKFFIEYPGYLRNYLVTVCYSEVKVFINNDYI